MESRQVLIVEDDNGVGSLLLQACREAGYEVTLVENGTEAVEAVEASTFDLILLDLMLPGADGLEVCRQIREDGRELPVLIITARDTLESKIEGLDAGADDYMCKPFKVQEVLARMRALLRRKPANDTVLRTGDLVLDTKRRLASRGDDANIRLSATECTLLEHMMRHHTQVLSRTDILEHVWHYDFGGKDNVLDVYIGYLRHKLEKGKNRIIHTVRGIGYRLDVG